MKCVRAAFFHLYLPTEATGDWRPAVGETAEDLARLKASFPTPRHAVAYIMNSFPIVRRKDEEKYEGDYRDTDERLVGRELGARDELVGGRFHVGDVALERK